jgi:hypothetical protein
VRNRLIVTGTAAAFVLTAGIVGAVAVQPGQEHGLEPSAGPAAPDALQGLPPVLLKREATSGPGEQGTVNVRSKPESPQNLFKYTPAPKPAYTPRHMADSSADQPAGDFTMAPVPGIDFGQGTGADKPTKPSFRPTPDPVQPTPPEQTPRPTPPTPTPTPSPSPEPTDPPSEEPTDPPSEEPTDPPTEEPTDPPSEEPTDPPSEEPTPEEPTVEPSPEPSTEPTPEPTEEPTPETSTEPSP